MARLSYNRAAKSVPARRSRPDGLNGKQGPWSASSTRSRQP